MAVISPECCGRRNRFDSSPCHSASSSQRSRPSYFCFDGPSDVPEHPNLPGFQYSFAPDDRSTDKANEAQEASCSFTAQALSRSDDKVAGKTPLVPRFLSRRRDTSPSSTLDTPSTERKHRNFSRPSLSSVSSFEYSKSDCCKTITLLSETRFPPGTAISPGLENTPPRSAKRVIRPDDWWKNKTPRDASDKLQIGPRGGLLPESLQVKSVEAENSGESPARVRPLKAPPAPSARVLVIREPLAKCTDSEQVPQHHSLPVQQADEKVPRITRENILRHILSVEDINAPSRPTTSQHSKPSAVESTQGEDVTMNLLHPESAAAMTEHRREAVRLARAQDKSVVEKCKRSGQDSPGYTFEELIGKGSYGRVYKGRQTATSKVVAIKVLDVDEADFQAYGEAKDEQMRDFNREIRILRQAQESGAPNMNQIIEALPVHSQLWMICEYCPGGSVKTLMRATNDRLSEKYIVVVGRELAKALKGLHDAGIMHRDVKAANVLIHEEGRLQLCDFGVAGVLEQRTDKRRTFIGTLHWMPPELWTDEPEYSDEVDVWEYGVTLYECALGKPPNSDLRERQQLKSRMRRLKQSIGLPEHEDFSGGLRSLVKFALSPEATTRPSMKEVLEHEYLRETEETHPTRSLSNLVQVYYQWLYSGGQRASLFMPGGAVVTDAGEWIPASDEWNFSTTELFDKRVSAMFEVPSLSEFSPTDSTEGEDTPKVAQLMTFSLPPLPEMTNVQKANFEARVKRGADLSSLFDQEQPRYEYKIKKDFVPMLEEQRRTSDLPFRAMAEDRPTSIASNVIDLGDFDESDYAVAAPKKEEKIQLADAATIRAKRGDSKGPRDGAAAGNMGIRRTSSSEDMPQKSLAVATQDFAFPPKEWAEHSFDHDLHSQSVPVDSTSISEKTDSRETARQTMDWTFATAMPTKLEEPEEDSARVIEANPPKAGKSTKHATLDWSFSSAMAEASETDTDAEDINEAPRSTRTTPVRPAPLLRMMTQPVTLSEVHHAEDSPRPSTAQSEVSESSFSSADFDPFSLDSSSQDEAVGGIDPAGLDEIGVSGFYASRGRTLVPNAEGMGMQAVPYASTVAGPAPFMLGRPARIGEDGFPGPAVGQMPNLVRGITAPAAPMPASKREGKKKKSTSVSSSGGKPKVEMPESIPPSEASLRGDAGAEVVENELQRLLGGLQQSLAGASQALGMMRRGGRRRNGTGGKGGRGRPSSSEWEDEE